MNAAEEWAGLFEHAEDREIAFSRTFDAPRELVFGAWTEPEHLAQWFGPSGFRLTTHQMELRVGGLWRFTMHGPDGTDYPNRVEYLEIDPPTRLIYAQNDDTEGAPPMFHAMITFAENAGGTELRLRMVFPTAEARDETEAKYGAIEGGHQTLERLREHLKRMS